MKGCIAGKQCIVFIDPCEPLRACKGCEWARGRGGSGAGEGERG